MFFLACGRKDHVVDGRFMELAQHPVNALALQDIIPDFSTVGYAHGDEPIPDYPVRETLSPQSGIDMTEAIQAALDRVAANHPEGGAVLLCEGSYEVSGTLFLDRSKVVLRGESREKTILKLTGTTLRPGIVVGTSVDRQLVVSQLEVEAREGRKNLNLLLPAAESPEFFSRFACPSPIAPWADILLWWTVPRPLPWAMR